MMNNDVASLLASWKKQDLTQSMELKLESSKLKA
jgi:hypothetical protein